MEMLAEGLVQPWVLSHEMEARLSATDETLVWLKSLSPESVKPYAGKWIAAQDCRILAAAESLEFLLGQLAGVDLATVLIHRFEKPGRAVYR